MTPSDRQEVIYDEFEHGNRNILIQSVAGSGKTTTLLHLLRLAPYRTLFVAFNKSIQEEIQQHIDSNGLVHGKAMTMHSMGLLAIRNRYRYKVNNNKNYEMLKQIQEDNKDLFQYMRWEERAKIIFTLMDMNDVSRIYLTDDIEEIKQHMISMDKQYYSADFMQSLWQQMLVLREAYYNKPKVEIDFIDMIYLPVHRDLEIPIRTAYLFIDEAQDLNLAQHKLIDKLLSQGDVERWVAVGDRNQSIYGFAGSHASSFDLFAEKENVVELPLDICYRCSVDVLRSANEVYNIMRGFKTSPGRVGEVRDPLSIKNDSMVICRNSAPLLDLYFILMGQGRKVFIKGDDILGSIRSFMKPYKGKTIDYVLGKLRGKITELEGKQDDNSRFERYKAMDQLEILNSLIKGGVTDSWRGTVDQLMSDLDSIFREGTDGGIVLCTIHKAKGLQAPVVYILNEHLIPSKYAKSEQQLQQEENLKYVARTRAEEELYQLIL